MAALKQCPTCRLPLSTPTLVSLAVNHEEEDKRLNAVAHAAADLIAKETMSLYPKPLPPRLKALKEALEKFAQVDTEMAERNYVVGKLITMEKELGA